tara:strand:- start:1917 stop:3077 length:1161 start_codon:yes stop_codon:yes gene_type:complete
LKKVLVFIGSRANYASSKSLLIELKKNKKINLIIVLAASALSEKFGNLEKIIKNDGFSIKYRVFSLFEGENHKAMTKTIGQTITDSVVVLEISNPDWVVVIGDRNEVLGFTICAAYMNFKIAHTMGGEVSGTIDESARHAISKLSHLHFTACSSATKRLKMMGENKKNIIQSGCPRIDEVKKILRSKKPKIFDKEMINGVGKKFKIKKNKFILLSFHPVTTETLNYSNLEKILIYLAKLNINVVVLWPNSDAGSDQISKCYRSYREKKMLENFSFYKNLSFESYIYLMSKCLFLIGNSSSGVREGSFIGCKVINIGSRQNNRDIGDNLIHVKEPITKNKISNACNKILKKRSIKKKFIYGKGNASKIIVNKILNSNINQQKEWIEN